MAFDILKKRRTAKLWEEAQSLLANRSYAEVLAIAERLERERYSGAFDLAAQAYAGLGKLEDAICVLERGVGAAPQAWPNWQLLGKALKAHLLLATNDPRGAVLECEGIERPKSPTAEQRYWLADSSVTHAKALAATGESSAVVRGLVVDAIGIYPESQALLSYLRELRSETSTAAKLFGVTISYGLDAAARSEFGAVGFVRSGQVIADTPEEAVGLMRELEGTGLLMLEDHPELEPLKRSLVRSRASSCVALAITTRHAECSTGEGDECHKTSRSDHF